MTHKPGYIMDGLLQSFNQDYDVPSWFPFTAHSPTMSINIIVTSSCDRASWAMSLPLGMFAECDRNSITCFGKICTLSTRGRGTDIRHFIHTVVPHLPPMVGAPLACPTCAVHFLYYTAQQSLIACPSLTCPSMSMCFSAMWAMEVSSRTRGVTSL